MPRSTHPVLAPVAPGTTPPSHPFFVGLAHLRSLLAHEEVAESAERTDAVLDMISVLLHQRPAAQALRAFCAVRQSCEPACYLALYRLRRWLESQIAVRVGTGNWRPLDLRFRSHALVVKHYQREAWEWQEADAAPQVAFAWSGLPEVAPGAAERAQLASVL